MGSVFQHLRLKFGLFLGRAEGARDRAQMAMIVPSPAATAVTGLSRTDRNAQVLRSVEEGRRIVARQWQFIAKRKASHLDATEAEKLLESFQRMQKIFEDDLAGVLRK